MSGENDDLFSKLANLIEESNRKQTVELKKEINVEVASLKEEISNIKEVLSQEKNERLQLEGRYYQTEKKIQHFEKSVRKNNIVIFRLDHKTDNVRSLAEFVVSKLNSLLDLQLNITCLDNTFVIGKLEGKRPILVKFLSFLTKIQVLRECKKLKGTGVSISEDLTKEEREIRRTLVKHRNEAKRNGYSAYVKGNLLYVNGEPYSYANLIEKNKEAEISPELINCEGETDEDAEADTVEQQDDKKEPKEQSPLDPKPKKRKIGTTTATSTCPTRRVNNPSTSRNQI